MAKKKLLVISIDSMINEDLEIMRALPNFRQIMEGSSIVHNVESTYPTLTHSIHTSIITGCYPEHHRVIHNEQYMPFTKPVPWFQEKHLCQRPMLPDEGMKAGLTAAYVYWPVTLGAPAQWNLHRGGIHAKPEDLIETLRSRATPGLFDEVYPYVKDSFGEPDHYRADDRFCCEASAYLIETYQPDMLYTHLIMIDHARHVGGVHGEHIRKGYEFIDMHLGKVIDAMKASGVYEDTVIAITSDHGHLDIERVVSINRFLQDHGLQKADAEGRMIEYDVYCHSCSLSAQIYAKDEAFAEQAKALLWENRELLGIGEILDKETCRKRYHTDGDYAFMIETDGRSSFSAMPNFPLITPTDNSDYRTSKATHGHQPERGPLPAFILKNPHASKTVSVPFGRIVDQAPTLAAIMGFDMPQSDGQVIRELL